MSHESSNITHRLNELKITNSLEQISNSLTPAFTSKAPGWYSLSQEGWRHGWQHLQKPTSSKTDSQRNQQLCLTSGHTVKYRLQIESLVLGWKSSVAYNCIWIKWDYRKKYTDICKSMCIWCEWLEIKCCFYITANHWWKKNPWCIWPWINLRNLSYIMLSSNTINTWSQSFWSSSTSQ